MTAPIKIVGAVGVGSSAVLGGVILSTPNRSSEPPPKTRSRTAKRRLSRIVRRAKLQLTLKANYFGLLLVYFALKAKNLFLECRVAHLRLTLWLVDHGLSEIWKRRTPPNDPKLSHADGRAAPQT
jgi:hypothetical protein